MRALTMMELVRDVYIYTTYTAYDWLRRGNFIDAYRLSNVNNQIDSGFHTSGEPNALCSGVTTGSTC